MPGTLQINSASSAGTGTITNNSVLALNIGQASLNRPVSGAGAINIMETVGDNTAFAGSLANFTGMINCPASPGGIPKAVIQTGISVNSSAVFNIASGGTLYLTDVTLPAGVTVTGTGNGEGYGALRVGGLAVVSGAVPPDRQRQFRPGGH